MTGWTLNLQHSEATRDLYREFMRNFQKTANDIKNSKLRNEFEYSRK